MSNSITKRCPRCNQDLPATTEYFLPRRSDETRLQSWCRSCLRAAVRDHYKRNPEKINRKAEEWARSNPEKVKEKSKRWNERHPERRKEIDRLYAENHKEQKSKARKLRYKNENGKKKAREYQREHQEIYKKAQAKYKENHPGYYTKGNQVRRARKLALPATLTKEQWEQIKAEWNYRCAYCGRYWFEVEGVLHQEHVIPLSQGGGYVYKNIVPACATCNSQKRGRTPEQAGMVLLVNIKIVIS